MDAANFLSGFDGIQAGDMSSLLEQFEEASQIWTTCMNDSESGLTLSDAILPIDTDAILPIDSIVGSDVQIHTDMTDGQDEEITEQTFIDDENVALLPDGDALDMLGVVDYLTPYTVNEITVTTEPEAYMNDDIVALSNDTEYEQCDLDTGILNNDCITDHNYCQDKTKIADIVLADANVECASDDGEIISDGEDDDVQITYTIPRESECNNNNNINFEKIRKTNCQNKRNYRRKSRLPAALDVIVDDSVYFDKIPTYFTALSIPNKNMIKRRTDTSSTTTGLLFTDFIPRDSSPIRKPDSDVLDKLPAYYSCFTNSTRYDETGADVADDIEEVDIEEQVLPESTADDSHDSHDSTEHNKYPWDRMRDKTFSAQSSRSQSPIVLSPDSVHVDISTCVPSRSRSRSSSQSSWSSCSSDCSSDCVVSPVRTRDKEIRGQRLRNKRKSSYSSRSRSRSWSHSRSRSRSRSPHSRRSRSRSWHRSRSHKRHRSKASLSRSRERRRQEYVKKRQLVKDKQMKDRRIVYVGRIPEDYTRKQLYRRFERFGDIDEVSVHFREHDDNYGFVTFAYTCDAYAAIEKGNRVPESHGHFDLCFGGRRQFCETQYADLDGQKEEDEEYDMVPKGSLSASLDFDELLRQAKTKIKKSS